MNITTTLNELFISIPALQNNYFYAFVIFLTFFILMKLFVFVVERIVVGFAEKTKTKLDDNLVEAVRGPLTYFIMVIGLFLGFNYLQLGGLINFIVGTAIYSALIILAVVIVSRVFRVVIDHFGHRWAKKTASTIDDALLPLSKKIINAIFIIFAVIWILKLWNVDVTGLLAGVGIAGIAIGFAIKDSLANIFGGISLLFDKAFQVGDMIELESGIKGVVDDIGIRSTRVRTFNNELMIIPNGQLANGRVTNYNQPTLSARVVVSFGVEYGTKHEKVKKLVLDTVAKISNMLDDPAPVVVFTSMGDSALLFEAKFWVKNISERYETKEKATCMIYDALNKAKIGIPFPTRTVHVKK
ncbi:mechanosensitive ion channel family protein [Candidatus Woesearchaeota archaeon]|jgi:MscS family membrane protein|nr:mechanosensitive ion channel family protein [Candidatus Woesearchaeota archaeon]MBT6519324.1 mechanosensitive ion channel family protein [Candidatus Woesearchaeota archaeon]MBT7366784.1 mechanosensitive ion channel family protein [Candidatus Woesearchaeota archaeon]